MASESSMMSELVREMRDSSEQMRNALCVVYGTACSYYEGCQWIDNWRNVLTQRAGLGRVLTNWNPDSYRGMRATVNRIASLVHKSATASMPERFDVDCSPPPRDNGTETGLKAKICEAAINHFIDRLGVVQAGRNANTRRCIGGVHGLVMHCRYGMRSVGGAEPEQDAVMAVEDFDPTMLILDPSCQKLDLWDHETVIFTDVWSISKIRNVLGVKLNPDDCGTMGELQTMKTAMNKISDGRVFSEIGTYSKTKGAVVYWVYRKGESGRFDQCWCGYETKGNRENRSAREDSIQWINADDPTSPFGGSYGLPLMLLHGQRRADSMWSLGDATLLKDDQDRINATASMLLRQLQKSGGGATQWLVSREAMSANGLSVDGFEQAINNRIGGAIWYSSGTRDRPAPAPTMIQHPPPQPMLQSMIDGFGSDMEQIINRPPVSRGEVKSHVGNATFQTALDQADQPLSMRVREDLDRYLVFFDCILGTVINFAKMMSPTTLGELRDCGFSDEDFGVFMGMDPIRPGIDMRIRESSVRLRSRTERRQDLTDAVTAQAINPMEYRQAFSETLDSPLTDTDDAFSTAANRSAYRVMMGEEWVPVSLGAYADWFLTAFRKAVFDQRIANDPEAKDRLWRAIQNQQAFELSLVQQTANAEADTISGSPTEAQPQDDADAAVGRLIEGLTGQSSQGADQLIGV